MTVVFGYFILNIMYLPSNTFCADGFAIITVFKIRRGYQRYLARSDLNCILISNKYVRISRNDQNLSNINIPGIYINCINIYSRISILRTGQRSAQDFKFCEEIHRTSKQ